MVLWCIVNRGSSMESVYALAYAHGMSLCMEKQSGSSRTVSKKKSAGEASG